MYILFRKGRIFMVVMNIDVEKYLKIIVMYDEFSNINYGMTKSDLYDELLNKLLSFSHDLHKIVV